MTFIPTDTTDYTTATATVTLQVIPTTPTITWAAPAAIVYGTALGAAQLNAKVTFNGVAVAGDLVGDTNVMPGVAHVDRIVGWAGYFCTAGRFSTG